MARLKGDEASQFSAPRLWSLVARQHLLNMISSYAHSMDNERIREICLARPHTAETQNWEQVLVYWVGEREIGGKFFAMTYVDNAGDVILIWSHLEFLSKGGSWKNRVK